MAGAYSWLGALDYQTSFLIHTALMSVALVAAIRLLWPWLEEVGWPLVAIVALAVAFYPLLRAIPGGQNTSLSLLVLAAAARWDRDGKSLRAGIVLALLLFKPQFGVVLLPLLLVARRWRMLAGWAGGAAVLFVVSTLLMGGAWISGWWDRATAFSETNLAANGTNFVSIPGFFENLAGPGSTWAPLVGYGLAAFAALGVAYFWWRYPDSYSVERYALAGAVIVIAAPQTLYYDAGLLLLGLVALRPWRHWRPLLWLPALIGITWSQPLAANIGWAPLGPIAWLAAAALGWGLLREAKPTPV